MASGPLFATVAARWQHSVEQQKEYRVIRDGNVFATGFSDNFLFRSEYEGAFRLKERLLTEYEGQTVDDVFAGREVETPFGICYEISSKTTCPPHLTDPHAVRELLYADLKLIRGIGQRTEERLKRRGYRTLHDLRGHSRYRNKADEVIRLIECGGTRELLEWITRWYPASHPIALNTSRIHSAENFIYFDIETLGLFSRPIILLGIGRLRGTTLTVSQYLLREIGEERAALREVASHFQEKGAALVTFNGRSFDLPYFRDRCAFYGERETTRIPHFDLLHYSRRRWKHDLPDCRLQTIERQIFGMKRGEDIPGALVPEFYQAFMSTANPGPLVPVVTHNRQDICTLVDIHQRLLEEWNGNHKPD